MRFLDVLDGRYRVILCDIWGCVHDGVQLYPGAAARLRQWRTDGRLVVLITNAPRTAAAIEQQLGRLGLPRDAWDHIVTSGEAGIAALTALGKAVGFVGTASDRAILEGRGVKIALGEQFTDLACTGLEGRRPDPADYAALLAQWAGTGVVMHCLNPDRMVIQGGIVQPCAGALADRFEALGGRVLWYGKPERAIYERALKLAGGPAAAEVLAIGDGLLTDILGAARMGFDGVFVTGGIAAGEPFPADFGRRHGVPEWQPVAVVDSLAAG